jgi:hypothetical protein
MTDQPPERLSFAETTVEALLTAAKPKIADLRGRTWDELEAAVRGHAAFLAEQNAHRAIDTPTRQWLLTSALILAVFRELEPLAGSTEVLSILRNAMTASFKESITGYLAVRFGIAQDAPEEAFARISENFKVRGEQRFGKAFVYFQDAQDVGRSFTNIHKCFFNDFFRSNGSPEVTSIFCALDSVWADALHEPRYGVRFDRPTTLANGDDACRFQFSKVPRSAAM